MRLLTFSRNVNVLVFHFEDKLFGNSQFCNYSITRITAELKRHFGSICMLTRNIMWPYFSQIVHILDLHFLCEILENVLILSTSTACVEISACRLNRLLLVHLVTDVRTHIRPNYAMTLHCSP